MKKVFILLLFLFVQYSYPAASSVGGERLDMHGRPLEYTEIEIINKASMPIIIKWQESVQGKWVPIQHIILPNERKFLQLGELGKFEDWGSALPQTRGNLDYRNRPYIEYHPVESDPKVEYIRMSLVRPGPIIFTADSLANILKKIYSLGVYYADKDGEVSKFSRTGLDKFSWERVMERFGQVKNIEPIDAEELYHGNPELEVSE